MQNGSASTISVIIPTQGRIPQLTSCLLSILQQQIKPNEIIVVDNTPQGCVFSFIKKLVQNSPIPILYVRETQPGASSARNKGIQFARFSILVFIDDDCVPKSDWLKSIVKFFSTHKDCVAIKGNNLNGLPDNLFASVEYFNDELFFQTHILKKNGVFYSPWVDTKNFAIKKTVFVDKRLHFNKHFRSFDDLAFSLDLRRKNITVYFAKEVQVFHYGRDYLFSHMLRDVGIGIDTYRLEAWMNEKKRRFSLSGLEKKYFIHYKKWGTEQEIKKRLLSYALNNKNLGYKIVFYVFFYLSITMVRVTYHIEKVKLFKFSWL